MKKCKIYFLIILFIILSIFLIFSFKIVFAKYMFSKSIVVANVDIDRTSPQVTISYLPKNVTKDKIVVRIKANEEIKPIDGWILQDDKKTLIKEYDENIIEEIEIEDLAGNKTKQKVTVAQIDKECPSIEILEITNDNKEYPTYANKEKAISVLIKITDNNSIYEKLKEEDIKIIVGTKEEFPKEKKIAYEKDTNKEKIAKLIVKGIEKDGILKIKILENTIKDEAKNPNKEVEKTSNIIIDNTKPEASFKQKELNDGKIQAIVTANERIKKLNGWEMTDEKILKKTFNNNLSYVIEIEDLAGNKQQVNINIVEATNVIMSYASHNSMVGWSYGYGNYDIAGLEAIKENSKYKTESLAFSISGNVDEDFLQARAFVYTNWGEGSKAMCNDSNQIYTYGWNPANSEWKYKTAQNRIILNNKNYFQLGGAGVNGEGETDLDGNGEISKELMEEYRYGISAIQLKLKSYENNSIIYQVYVDSIGWLKPAKNEEMACYRKDKPFSAIRVALVPNSELNSVYNLWNKDTGKTL